MLSFCNAFMWLVNSRWTVTGIVSGSVLHCVSSSGYCCSSPFSIFPALYSSLHKSLFTLHDDSTPWRHLFVSLYRLKMSSRYAVLIQNHSLSLTVQGVSFEKFFNSVAQFQNTPALRPVRANTPLCVGGVFDLPHHRINLQTDACWVGLALMKFTILTSVARSEVTRQVFCWPVPGDVSYTEI